MKLRIAKTKSTGLGIFATKDIKKGESVLIFKGKIKKYFGHDLRVGRYWLGLGKNMWIDVPKENLGHYINHSCTPNSGIKGKQKVVAMKNIKKGEQTTIDYSVTEEDLKWKMNCKCGGKNCRKTIRSVQFLPKRTFKKYLPYIPKFAQKAYRYFNSESMEKYLGK